MPADTANALPAARQVAGLRLPPAVVVTTVLLGLALQWVIVRVYAELGVSMFGGALAHGAAGLEVPISYVLTALASAACALYCRTRPGPGRMLVSIHLAA